MTMDMKIYVEDKNLGPDSWVQTRDVTSSIRMIDRYWESISVISLDHDIELVLECCQGKVNPECPGCRTSRFASDETFEAVARFVAQKIQANPGKPIPVINLHTSNGTGKENMKRILLAAAPDLKIYDVQRDGIHAGDL